MNFRSVHVGVVAVAVMVTVAGCATSNGSRTAADDPEMQRLVSSMEPSSRALALEGLSTLPNDSFVSVQFCNSMSNVKAASMSVLELHDYFANGLDSIMRSTDPMSMTAALIPKLSDVVDSVEDNLNGYEPYVTELILECVNVLSGKRGVG